MSNRGEEWKKFSPLVLEHIDRYTTARYGDKSYLRFIRYLEEYQRL